MTGQPPSYTQQAEVIELMLFECETRISGLHHHPKSRREAMRRQFEKEHAALTETLRLLVTLAEAEASGSLIIFGSPELVAQSVGTAPSASPSPPSPKVH